MLSGGPIALPSHHIWSVIGDRRSQRSRASSRRELAREDHVDGASWAHMRAGHHGGQKGGHTTCCR